MLFKADPTFYPSPKLAMQGPRERLAYVAALNANGGILDHQADRPERCGCQSMPALLQQRWSVGIDVPAF